jgi:FMN reductase
MLSIIDKCKYLVIRREYASHHTCGQPALPFPLQRASGIPERRSAADIEVCHWHLQNFAPEDLLYARFDNPALHALNEQLAGADGLIIATPVYKASFSGALKTLLDLLPERAGGQNRSAAGYRRNHRPYAGGGLRLKTGTQRAESQEILHGVFADDSQVTDYQHKPQFTPNLQGASTRRWKPSGRRCIAPAAARRR